MRICSIIIHVDWKLKKATLVLKDCELLPILLTHFHTAVKKGNAPVKKSNAPVCMWLIAMKPTFGLVS